MGLTHVHTDVRIHTHTDTRFQARNHKTSARLAARPTALEGRGQALGVKMAVRLVRIFTAHCVQTRPELFAGEVLLTLTYTLT